MPINNSFYGAYQSVGIQTSGGIQPVIVKSFTQNTKLDAKPVNYVQGSPLAKIINIGKVSQSIIVDSPLLISGAGGGSLYDGRTLLTSKISDIITNSFNAQLPVVSKATLTVNEAESSVNITLLSDGNPNVFIGIATIAAGNSGLPVPSAIKTALRNPTRVARFYDFVVSVGQFNNYVIEASFDFELVTEEKVFLGAYDTVNGFPGNSGGSSSWYYQNTATTGVGGSNDPLYNQGLPFPYIGVGGIKITGRGKAAVGITSNSSINYSSYLTSAQTKDNLYQYSDVTMQIPGDVITTSNSFAFWIRNGIGNTWTNLFAAMGIGITYQLNTGFNLKITPDLMTADFEFIAWLSD